MALRDLQYLDFMAEYQDNLSIITSKWLHGNLTTQLESKSTKVPENWIIATQALLPKEHLD